MHAGMQQVATSQLPSANLQRSKQQLQVSNNLWRPGVQQVTAINKTFFMLQEVTAINKKMVMSTCPIASITA
jgi:hypothetical protein